MLDYSATVSQLDTETAHHLSQYFGLPDPLLPLAVVLRERGLWQADIVLALLRINTPPALLAVEELMGKPINHLPPAMPRYRPAKVVRTPEQRTFIAGLCRYNPRLPTTLAWQKWNSLRHGLSVAQVIGRGLLTRRDLAEAVGMGWLLLREEPA